MVGADMPESGEPKPVSGQRPRRRGRRGGRGRGRGPRPPQSIVAPATPAAETLAEAPALLEAVAKVAGEISPARRPQSSAIGQAIDEISQIIEALKRVLEQMEDVLELAELAERQKTADEQEIESLRRALRQLQRPGGPRRREDETAQA
jgi:hypothetical protein